MLSRIVLSASNVGRKIPRNAFGICTYPEDSKEEMTITDNGDVIVCWHPEKSFPYQYSKPLPPPEKPSDSIYNLDTKEKVYEVFTEKKPEYVREKLMELTHTTKHLWYPCTRVKKRKKTPPNRPYL